MLVFIAKNRIIFITILISLAVWVGFLNGFQHLLNAELLAGEGESYYPYTLSSGFDVVNVVAPRIDEVLGGNIVVSDTDIYEYKDSSPVWSPLSPLFFFPFKFFTDSIDKVLIAADFIFPAASFFLFFVLYYYVSGKRRWLSLFFAFFTSLYVYFSIYFPPPSMDYIKISLNTLLPFTDSPEAHFLTRKESYIPSLIPLLLSFIFTLLSLIKQRKIFAVLAGLFYALIAYSYPFHFIYASSGLGVLFLLLVVAKDKKNLKQLLILFLSALVFLIPFFIVQIGLRDLPQYSEILQRNGIELGGDFRWEHWQRYLWSIIIAFSVFLWGKEEKKKATSYFIISLLLSNIIVLNMQMILGFAVQTDHWLNRDILWSFNLAYFVLIWWFIDFLKKKHRFWRPGIAILGVLLIVSMSVNSLRYSIAAADQEYSRHAMPSGIMDALKWLDGNTSAGSVVMTPSLVSNILIPMYTHNKIFIPRALTSITPEDEMLERVNITYKTFGVDINYLEYILDPELSSARDVGEDKYSFAEQEKRGVLILFANRYSNKSLKAYTGNYGSMWILPDDRLVNILNNYETFDCDNCLNKYKADYVFYGPQEKGVTDIDFSKSDFLERVYSNKEVEIYKVLN